MEELTKAEEKVMQAIWDLGRGFIRDIIAHLDEKPAPAYTTISTIVRILETKGFVGHRVFGKTYEYHYLVSKEDYRKSNFRRLVVDYFDGKLGNVLSYMVNEEKLSSKELDELKKFIDQQ